MIPRSGMLKASIKVRTFPAMMSQMIRFMTQRESSIVTTP